MGQFFQVEPENRFHIMLIQLCTHFIAFPAVLNPLSHGCIQIFPVRRNHECLRHQGRIEEKLCTTVDHLQVTQAVMLGAHFNQGCGCLYGYNEGLALLFHRLQRTQNIAAPGRALAFTPGRRPYIDRWVRALTGCDE